jgi:hypothetical protein
MNDGAKWATFDLLKALDIIFDGRHHETFHRIAWDDLNLALPVLPPPPPDPAPAIADAAAGEPSDPAPCFEADKEAAGQDVHSRWIDECLDLSNPNATLLLADLFASWTAWTERERKFTGTTNALSRELVRRWGEARKGHANTGIFFKGVKLK